MRSDFVRKYAAFSGQNPTVYYNMTQTETTNIIIALRNEGWAADKINDFITFVSTHKPSEEEAGSGKYDFSKKK